MGTNDTLRLALTQAKDQGDPTKNLEHHEHLIQQAAHQDAHVVCLQELFKTRYFPQHQDERFFDHAEPIPGETTDRLSHLATEHDLVIFAPLFEERAPGIYHNTAAIIDTDGTIQGTYRKMHIPHDPNFYEKYYFTPGDTQDPFPVFDTAHGRIGVMICWDQWFPEPARIMTLKDADVILYPTCIGHAEADQAVHEDQQEAWQLAQRAHALANGTYVAAANRTGPEGTLTFWGKSFIADPFGRITAQAPYNQEHVLVEPLDLSLKQDTRRAWPFLRDRRPEAYDSVTKRHITDA